uniref:SF3 helicase domain-containing protein n=1 Tax=viral metagenome TaxID=1070528 RepID=A0A6C0LZ65_9ZZZZ
MLFSIYYYVVVDTKMFNKIFTNTSECSYHSSDMDSPSKKDIAGAKLLAYIADRKVRKGEPFTHTSHITPTGSFNIEDDDISTFWILWCNAVKADARLGFNENPAKRQATSLHLDFDFEHSLDAGLRRYYTEEHIKAVVKIYQEIIETISLPSALEANPKLIHCIVMERQIPRVKHGVVKDGVHIHFPFFCTTPWIQDHYIRDIAIEEIVKRRVFEFMSLNNTIDKVVDPVATKTWGLYGSIREKGVEPYRISHIYDESVQEVGISVLFGDLMKGRKSSIEYYIPQFLSLIYNDTPVTPLLEKVEAAKQLQDAEKKRRRPKNVGTRSAIDAAEDMRVLEEGNIMGMLNRSRAETYNEWMDVGWCLFSVGQGSLSAMNAWIEFSKRSEKYKEGVCEQAWNKMEYKTGVNGGNKTIASLLYMAKLDSPNEFFEWKDSKVKYTMRQAIEMPKINHNAIARVMHELYKNQFVCCNSKKDEWYEFRGHVWVYVDDGVSIKLRIMNELPQKFAVLHQIYMDEYFKGNDKEANRGRAERSQKIIFELGVKNFVHSVLDMCKVYFYDSKFIERINENRMLVAFQNGVYDLDIGMFRDGRPDDYITICSDVYYQDYTPSDDDVLEIMDYLRKVFPNENIRNYFLDIACSCLKGGNDEKIFAILTGDGDNSKSVAVQLMELVFGEYCMKFPRELLAKGNGSSSGSARPELARVRGKRLAFVQELAKNEKLNVGVLKELTGNDSFFARTLYEKGADIKPMFTLMLMCNEPPEIPAHDQATWNRVRVILFESLFPKNASLVPETEEEQFSKKIFPRINDFDKRLPELASPFLWVLLERFRVYKVKGIYEPTEVTYATDRYKTRNDVYRQFIDECVHTMDEDEIKAEIASEPRAESRTHIKLQDLYVTFKHWHRINYPSYTKDIVGRGAMKSEIEKLMGTIGAKSRWYGYQIAQDETLIE